MDIIKIKQAVPSEAELIADLSRETFYETFASQNTKSDMDLFLKEQFSKDKLVAQVGEKGNHFFLAYCDDQIAGYVFLKEVAHASLTVASAIEISRIYVTSFFTGKGIGKQLMQTAIEFAVSKQVSLIWLGVWEHNQRAIRFYESYGFTKFGEHDFLLGRDMQRDWLMKRLLSE